jgi:hypothetical protein
MSGASSSKKGILFLFLSLLFRHAAFEDLNISDIPANQLVKYKDMIAYQGVHIQSSFMDIMRAMKMSFQHTEAEQHYLQAKVPLKTISTPLFRPITLIKMYQPLEFIGVKNFLKGSPEGESYCGTECTLAL